MTRMTENIHPSSFIIITGLKVVKYNNYFCTEKNKNKKESKEFVYYYRLVSIKYEMEPEGSKT